MVVERRGGAFCSVNVSSQQWSAPNGVSDDDAHPIGALEWLWCLARTGRPLGCRNIWRGPVRTHMRHLLSAALRPRSKGEAHEI